MELATPRCLLWTMTMRSGAEQGHSGTRFRCEIIGVRCPGPTWQLERKFPLICCDALSVWCGAHQWQTVIRWSRSANVGVPFVVGNLVLAEEDLVARMQCLLRLTCDVS